MEARANFFGDLMKDFEKFTLFWKHIVIFLKIYPLNVENLPLY